MRAFLALVDRGFALFVGIAVGVVLGLSFLTDGKPFDRIFNPRPPAPPPVVVARAAPACTEAFPLSKAVIARLRAGKPLRIGVFGDSFGDGLWAATNQELHADPDFAVYRFAKEATGFTRYRSLDLLADAKAKVAQQPIDIALIDFGANDTQGVWDDARAYAYMTPGWRRTVGDRATALVAFLQDQGAAVGWVGLPRMRQSNYDNQIQAMNGFYAELMCRLHVPFIDPVSVTETDAHGFSMQLKDPETGIAYLARADDGVHMSVHGYRVMARPLLRRIEALSSRDAPP